MGSSKKHKEKREKKKHKRRSRSRSHDRESRKRHKHSHDRGKKHSHESHSRSKDHDRKKHAESSEDEFDMKRPESVQNETSIGCISGLQVGQVSPSALARRIVEHYSSGDEEDDFDPESLLEEKLLENEKYSSSSRPAKKNVPNILQTLMCKDYQNLEMLRQVIMKEGSVQGFPGDFQISITNREAENSPRMKADKVSLDKFEYLPPQKRIKVKEELDPVYEAARQEHRYEATRQEHQYEATEWKETEAEPSRAGPSHQSLSIHDIEKLRSKLGLKPLGLTKDIPGIGGNDESVGFIQSSRSNIETNMLRDSEKPSVKLQQASPVVPSAEVDTNSCGFQNQESLSISDKIRAKLGLKPLQVLQSVPEVEADSSKRNQQSPGITETSKSKTKLGKRSLQVPEVEPEQENEGQSQLSLSISQTNKSKTKLGKRSLQVSKQVPEVEPEQEKEGQSQLSLSISQTNELRAKLGLKPLQVSESIPGLGAGEEEKDTSSTSTKEVFVKTENLTEKREAEKLREKLKTQKEKRKIAEKLKKVKQIAESDSEDESAAVWVKKSRKLQEEKEKAEKRAKLLEEMDAEFGVSALVEQEFVGKDKSYTSANLRGLTVSHAVDSFREGHHVILTLKDKDVLDEEEDVLENVNLIDEEKYARNAENRKKKPLYIPYDEPEFDEFGILKKKNILYKYDDEEESTQKKTFKLGDENYLDKEKELELIRMKLKQKQGISLEMTNIKLATEYYTAEEEMVQFKKPKKKRKVRRRVLKADDLIPDTDGIDESNYGRRNYTETELDDAYIYGVVPRIQPEPESHMEEVKAEEETEEPDIIGPSEDLTGVVVDEDQAEKELNAALNKAMRLKQRKAVVSAPEKIVEMLKKSNTGDMDTTPETKSAPIVLNSTAEFCRTLGEIPTYGMSGNRDEEADELLDFERELIEERKKQEMEAQNRGAWNEVDIDEKPAEILVKENEPILEEEPDIRIGVAGALALAQKKGYLDKDTKKTAAAHRVSQLQAQSYTIEEKFYDDDKFGKRDRYTGPIQDFREKVGYRPDIKLEYIDDSGRLLTAKEAFRYLSHKFHGKGPGKNKVDKRMKKVDQETRLKQMSSTDTPLNTVKLLQAKQKEMQSPYIVLSGGSKTLTQTMISKTKPT